MNSPQLENGYAQIANEILDVLGTTYLSPYEWQVLMILFRKTYGFHKKADRSANSQFVLATGLHKSHVSRTVKKLLVRRIVAQTGNILSFNKDSSSWLPKQVTIQKLPKQDTLLPKQVTGVTQTGNKSYLNRRTQKIKDTITKDTIQKIIHTPIEKKIREPITEVQRVVVFLEKTLGSKIVNFQKQAKAWKAMSLAGYTEEQICAAISVMWNEEYWKGKGFDLMTVSNQIPKIAAAAKDQNQKERAEHYKNNYKKEEYAVDA